MTKLHSVLSSCENLDLQSSYGLAVKQDLILLCGQYLKIFENDKAVQSFLNSIQNVFRNILILDPKIPHRERIQLLDIHFKLIKMPIGYAKMHIPKYRTQDVDKLIELPYEVVTFSAYKRLQALEYDLSDYRYISSIKFLGLAEHIYFGINEIHEISVFTKKPI